MTNKTRILPALGFAIAILLSLSCNSRDENAAEERARQFAQNYFNLRFKQAAELCTPSSAKWVRFRASNISQEDLDVVNSQQDTAVCEVEDVSGDEDAATATINVKNFLRSDSIGRKGRMCKEARYSVAMRKQDDTWLVDLDSPL